MTHASAFGRRKLFAGAAGLLAAPSIARGGTATRGVTDKEIVIGNMTDLSGVTAVQGTNNAYALRLAFDEINAKGGIHGRKVNLVVEDMQYIVPKAVQAMNKLLNRDNIFFALANGGTPMNDAVMPSMFEKNVPNVFPLTCARSMYEPFNRLKFGQFASYYDQMRAAVKYFAEKKGAKRIGVMYQDTDYGKDILAGAVAQVKEMGLTLAGTTGHQPTSTDFNAPVTKLHDAGCDLIIMGTIVKDTVIILQTARKMGWNVDFCGNFATYSTAVAEAPGGPAEGFYSMAPGLYAYPDDPRPQIKEVSARFRKRFGLDFNYLGETGWSAANFTIDVLQRAGRNLNVDTFIGAMESTKDWRDIFGSPPLTITPTNHHASSQSYLSVVRNARWAPVVNEPLGF